MREAAHAWRVLMADKPSDDDRRNFKLWLDERPEHRAAYARATTLWRAMGALDLERRRQRRSRIAVWAGGAAAACFAALLIVTPHNQRLEEEPASRRLQTAQGELRTITLDDQSEVTLGGDSEIRITYSSAERRASLVRGDAYLDVAKDTSRPFLVRAGGIEIRVVGTAFSVRQSGNGTAVEVSEGRVRVSGASAHASKKERDDTSEAMLTAGQTLRANLRGELSVAGTVAADNVAAWRTGRLIFNGTPLRDVVRTLDRYSASRIELGYTPRDSEAISATLRADDIDASLAMLSEIFGLQVERDKERAVLQERP